MLRCRPCFCECRPEPLHTRFCCPSRPCCGRGVRGCAVAGVHGRAVAGVQGRVWHAVLWCMLPWPALCVYGPLKQALTQWGMLCGPVPCPVLHTPLTCVCQLVVGCMLSQGVCSCAMARVDAETQADAGGGGRRVPSLLGALRQCNLPARTSPALCTTRAHRPCLLPCFPYIMRIAMRAYP